MNAKQAPGLVKAVPCPVCGRTNDCHSAADGSDAQPCEGDLSICFGCGAFLTYNADLSQRELMLEEVAMLKDPERIALQRARRAWEEVRG
jgi:hypothetical protein